MKRFLLAIVAVTKDGELLALDFCANFGWQSPLELSFGALDIDSPICSHGDFDLWRDFDSLFSDA